MTTTDPYALNETAIKDVHAQLKAVFEAVAAGAALPLEQLVPQAQAASGFLLGHHHAEGGILFPGIRRLGKLRSTDAAFLDQCDREHHELHALAEELAGHASSPHPFAVTLASLARDTLQLLAAHTSEEEKGLAADRLREMISLEGLMEIGRELEEFRNRFAQKQ